MTVGDSYKVWRRVITIVCDNYALFPDFRVLSNFEKALQNTRLSLLD